MGEKKRKEKKKDIKQVNKLGSVQESLIKLVTYVPRTALSTYYHLFSSWMPSWSALCQVAIPLPCLGQLPRGPPWWTSPNSGSTTRGARRSVKKSASVSGREREPTRGRGKGSGSESTAPQPWVITGALEIMSRLVEESVYRHQSWWFNQMLNATALETRTLPSCFCAVTRNGIDTVTTLSVAMSDTASDQAERKRKGTERGDTGTKRRGDTSPPGGTVICLWQNTHSHTHIHHTYAHDTTKSHQCHLNLSCILSKVSDINLLCLKHKNVVWAWASQILPSKIP